MQAQHKAPPTLKKYLTGARFYLKWCAANGHPAALDRRLVSAWIAEMLASGAEPATSHARLLGVRRFSAWLTDEGELDADPLAGIKPPKLDVKVVESLTDDQLRDLMQKTSGCRVKPGNLSRELRGSERSRYASWWTLGMAPARS
ncbi:site-specific integrase [Mycobacterium sp. 852014-52144_SCH5372336]|uniref:site-specific integrase n=1 Tax=Mycobacterium sp. 852014-52144_SCH5372336 TaxID=1834115 RepID=UPI000A473D17|nr:site-specific integrase [Mycobacterium sp. 852014-52144_SCH5372336]